LFDQNNEERVPKADDFTDDRTLSAETDNGKAKFDDDKLPTASLSPDLLKNCLIDVGLEDPFAATTIDLFNEPSYPAGYSPRSSSYATRELL
jgi:hypothetical protein